MFGAGQTAGTVLQSELSHDLSLFFYKGCGSHSMPGPGIHLVSFPPPKQHPCPMAHCQLSHSLCWELCLSCATLRTGLLSVVWGNVAPAKPGAGKVPARPCAWDGGVSRAGRGRAVTHPSGFALVLHGFFGVGHSPLHVVHRMLHVVLNAVNHLSLQEEDTAPAPTCMQT